MKPYTLTTAGQLKPGDQYMIEGSEIIYTVLSLRCNLPAVIYVRKGDLKLTDMVRKSKTVIFIKHAKL
jgi:hypothetical protein